MKSSDGTPTSLPSPLRLFLTVLVLVFAAEAAVMFLLPTFLPHAHVLINAIVDASILVALTAPLLWWLIVRPLRRIAVAEQLHAATVVAHVVDGIISIDERGLVKSFNPAAERMFGYEAAEVVGQPVTRLIPERYHEAHQEGLERVRAGGEPRLLGKTGELHGRRKDGSEFPLELSLATWQTEKGIFFNGIARDITERKRAEEALRAAHETLQAVIHASPLAITAISPDGDVRLWNPAAEQIFGWRELEVLGRPLPFVPDEKQDEFRTLRQRVLQGEVLTGVETRRQTRDGSPIDTTLWAGPLHDTEGNVTGIIGIVADSTKRKQAEEQLRLQSTALESAANAIFITDREGRITWVNPAFSRLTGYPAEEALGQTPRLLKSGKNEPAFYQGLWETILSGQVWQSEIINRRKDGSLYTEEQTITPVRDECGHISHFVAIHHDITARKQAEETLRAFYRASLHIQEPLELQERLARLLQTARDVLHLDRLNILLADPEGRWLEGLATLGTKEPLEAMRVPIEPKGGGIAQAYLTHEPVFWLDPQVPVPEPIRLQPPYNRLEAFRSRAFAILPLVVQGRTIGVLGADRKHSRQPLDAVTLELLHLFATQAALAIEHARLYEAVREEARREAALRTVGEALTANLRSEEILQVLVEKAVEVAQAEKGLLLTLDPEAQELRAAAFVGLSPAMGTFRVKVGESVTGRAVLWGRPIAIHDVETDTEHEVRVDIARREGIRALLTLPLTSKEQVVGAMSVYYAMPHAFSADEIARLTLYAHQAAIALENARLFHQGQERLAKLQAFYQATKLLTSERFLDAVLQQAVETAARVIGARYGAIVLWDEAGRLQMFIHTGLSPEEAARIGRPPAGKGILGVPLREGRPVRLEDLTQDPRAHGFPPHHPPMKRFLGVPITSKGKPLGHLYLTEKEAGPFTAEDEVLFTSFAEIIAGLIENAKLYEELRLAALQLEGKVEDRTRELQAANTQLEAASRHKSEFLANMSHELRTPLNSIIGFAELVGEQRVGPLNEKQARYLGHIFYSGKHLLQLISDILDLSKVEAGKFVLQPEALPVATTLEDILVIARGLANKKQHEISAEIESDLPPLLADLVRFKQILFNLLSNAVKFTPEQGRITLRARRAAGLPSSVSGPEGVPPTEDRGPGTEGACLEIQVGDTGIGIKREDLPRLFQEFVQLDATAAKRHEGTGLGLALTKRLVELHGGRIWAESEGEGRGSTFTVLLPFAAPGQPPNA